MPGQVLDIKIKEGDSIKKGDTVIVLSAMKVCKKKQRKKRRFHSSFIIYLDGNCSQEYSGR
jgi:acetyl/propionyl-CoA carboxylase alpha subunit